MKRALIVGLLLWPSIAGAISLTDAKTVTGATTGKVISTATVYVPSLTAAQKTALVSFVTSLGASWPGAAGNIIGLDVYRIDGAPNTIGVSLTGLIVHNDAAAAVNALTSGTTASIVGIVP